MMGLEGISKKKEKRKVYLEKKSRIDFEDTSIFTGQRAEKGDTCRRWDVNKQQRENKNNKYIYIPE